jgi:hypothetical protein
MSKNIIWMSAADGSWGGCDRDDLIIINEDDITTNEWDVIHDADDEKDVYDTLLSIKKRLNEQ